MMMMMITHSCLQLPSITHLHDITSSFYSNTHNAHTVGPNTAVGTAVDKTTTNKVRMPTIGMTPPAMVVVDLVVRIIGTWDGRNASKPMLPTVCMVF